MEIDAFFIADHVVTHLADGKFYVNGGGFTRAEVPSLPTPLSLGVLVRIRLDDAEAKEEHHLKISLIGPSGNPNVEPVEGIAAPLGDDPNSLDGEETFLQMAVTIPAMIVREGLYQVELELDGEVVRRTPLPVAVRPEKVLPETSG